MNVRVPGRHWLGVVGILLVAAASTGCGAVGTSSEEDRGAVVQSGSGSPSFISVSAGGCIPAV